MKNLRPYKIFVSFLLIFFYTMPIIKGQVTQQIKKKKIIQMYGLILDKKNNTVLPRVNIEVLNQLRGTFSSDNGMYSLAVLTGDTLIVSSSGYNSNVIIVPQKIKGDNYEYNIFLNHDTIILPTVKVKKLPTSKQFSRDFVRIRISNSQYNTALYNVNPYFLYSLSSRIPADDVEVYKVSSRGYTQDYIGQNIGTTIFPTQKNWYNFVTSFKRGYRNVQYRRIKYKSSLKRK